MKQPSEVTLKLPESTGENRCCSSSMPAVVATRNHLGERGVPGPSWAEVTRALPVEKAAGNKREDGGTRTPGVVVEEKQREDLGFYTTAGSP